MKRAVMCILIASILFICGCGNESRFSDELPAVQSKSIIIDTDAGADDAAAIIMAGLRPEIDILGITVVAGNVSQEQGVLNALMAMEIAGHTDVPVFSGASASVAGNEFELFTGYGNDGMGDSDLIHPSRTPETQNAVDFILEAVSATPGEVELIALGPSTNIALAIQKDPSVMSKVKHIWVMGTSGFGPGNATPVAEFNIYSDPDAFKILTDSELPLTVIGLDVNTEDTYLTDEDLQTMMQGNETERFLATALSKIMVFNQDSNGQSNVILSDPIAMACALWDGYLLETVPCHAEVITQPGQTYGQVLLYRQGDEDNAENTSEAFNVNLACKTRSDRFKTWFIQTLKEAYK